jgi:conjugal transfer mating pair stabilization protein TraN
MYSYCRTLVALIIIIYSNFSFAAFTSKFSCTDSDKYCSQTGGYRLIDGIKVYQSCWEYSYKKTCNVPSKNDCAKFRGATNCIKRVMDDYDPSDPDQEQGVCGCLAYDNDGSCLNEQREYMCENQIEEIVEKIELVLDPDNPNSATRLKCMSLGCKNGDCVDQTYESNDELGEALGYLSMASRMPEGVTGNAGNPPDLKNIRVNIFGGKYDHCNKKAFGYSNCCKDKGWGKSLGAKCRGFEKLLKARREGKCHYVGEYCAHKNKLGICTVKKQTYCCYDSLFSRVVQEQGRNQLGISYGEPQNPNCRGFSIEEVLRLDFKKMDLGEFYDEIYQKAKKNFDGDKFKEFQDRIKNSLPSINNNTNPSNKGFNIEAINKNNQQNQGHDNLKTNPNYYREKAK